jgi:hypothetical protein
MSRQAVQSDPLGSNPGEVVGDGGCVAVALWKMGVFEQYDQVVAALNEERELYRSKVRADQDCEAFLGVPNLTWHREIIKRTVIKAGFDYHIIPTKELHQSKKGLYLIDGIANWRFLLREDYVEPYDLEGPDDRPWKDRKGWQHVIGIKDGKIMRKHGKGILVDWLWMDKHGKIDQTKGFMYEIHKVYYITPQKKRGRQDDCS